MLKRIFTFFIVFVPGFLFFSCARSSVPATSALSASASGNGSAMPGPACIVYKTRADYSQNVPVILSEDKSSIMSFPDIRDLYYKGQFACPDPLSGGYLLDNRGIGPGVAFLTFTYEEYSRFGKTPPAVDLFGRILDKDPLLEMYQCGKKTQYSRPVEALNEIITKGGLKDCQRLK